MAKIASFFNLILLSSISSSFSAPTEKKKVLRTKSDLSSSDLSDDVNIKKAEKWSEYSPRNLKDLRVVDDIVYLPTARSGIIAESSHWPGGVVPYEIDDSFTPHGLDMIKRAIEIFHKYTCIKFRKRMSGDKDYLTIVNQDACTSWLGRRSGMQEVWLKEPYCTKKVGKPIHELMHAIGFHHEQNRFERDDHVLIIWDSIQNGTKQNFEKVEANITSGYGVEYDYLSVMHYPPTAFSVNGEPTIISKEPSKAAKMGQREGFSRGDIIKINAMYKCTNKLPEDKGDNVYNNL